jgi:hypothetical protein
MKKPTEGSSKKVNKIYSEESKRKKDELNQT